MRRFFLMIGIILIIATAAFIAVIMINNDYTDNDKQAEIKKTKENITEDKDLNEIEIVETSVEEEKVSPGCIFIFKTFYSRCEHIKLEKEIASETMVNKTRQELEKIYKNWQIVTFRNDEVLFYKDEEASCDEHYFLKIDNDVVAIYVIDENNNETLKEKTPIIATYLPKEDLERLNEGIKVYGKEELNSILEDFE